MATQELCTHFRLVVQPEQSHKKKVTILLGVMTVRASKDCNQESNLAKAESILSSIALRQSCILPTICKHGEYAVLCYPLLLVFIVLKYLCEKIIKQRWSIEQCKIYIYKQDIVFQDLFATVIDCLRQVLKKSYLWFYFVRIADLNSEIISIILQII